MASLPVYCISDFTTGQGEVSFYANALRSHLQQHDFITRPHRHDFFIIVYFSAGTGTHTIDFTTYDVKPGCIFLLSPGQVHSWVLSGDIEGEIIFFSRDFYESYFAKKHIADFSFFRYNQPVSILGREAQIMAIWHPLKEEYLLELPGNADCVCDYLDILLIHLSRYTAQQPELNLPDINWHIRELERLIDVHYLDHWEPHQYAEALHLSVKYLNELCRQYLGKTTTRLIHERQILEARRLLTHQSLSIKEVAQELRFEDSSYFSRFFKKMTGQTPEQFRKSIA